MKKRLAAFAIVLTMLSPFAAYSEDVRPKASEFPDKVIVIGTHVIYLDCLTQPLLDAAEASAAAENQMKIYYKSDINRGVWYDITESGDITEISGNTSNIVSNEVIDELILTHYTKMTGETVEFATGNIVNISNIDSMEYPENMPELDGILEELDLQNNLRGQKGLKKEREELYDKHIESLERLLARIETADVKKLHDDAEKLDKNVVKLQKENKSPQEISLASDALAVVMEQKDALCYEEEIKRFEEEIAALDYIDSATLIEKYNEWLTNLKGEEASKAGAGEESGDTGADSTDSVLTEMFLEAQQVYIDALIGGETGDGAEEGTGTGEGSGTADGTSGGDGTSGSSEGASDASSGADEALLDMQAIDALIQNNTNVSDEVKDKQTQILDKAKTGAIDKLAKAGDNTSLVVDEIGVYDDLLIDRLDNLTDILNALEKTKQAFEKTGQQTAAADTQKKIEEQTLNGNAAYQAYAQNETSAEQTMSKAYEDYLNAIEKGNNAAAQALKKALDEAAKAWQDAKQKSDAAQEEILANAENAKLSQAEYEKLKNDPSATDAQKQAAADKAKRDNDALDPANAFANDPDVKKAMGERDNAKTAAELAAANQKLNALVSALTSAALEAEKASAGTSAGAGETSGSQSGANTELINSLNAQYAPYTFQDSSFLIFENYDVRLKRPIMRSGKNIYVDARDLAVQMGAEVILSKTNNVVILRAKGALIEYIMGNKTIYVNDKKTEAKPAPLYIDGTEYIPLASFEKAFNLKERTEGEYTYVYK